MLGGLQEMENLEGGEQGRREGSLEGTTIDRYRLGKLIGEGGMGVVYLAEQLEPVQRIVAFKLIKLGMDTHEVIRRFETERQALAMMDHPGIAKVLDGGSTETGRPYFVMEHVEGSPITEFCDDLQLSMRQRLVLFTEVCEAAQHAHQKGIIHRDLKPSNVLAASREGKPVAQIIDFGVARAIEQEELERTLYTRHDQVVGTPVYMSPEQASGNHADLDTRTDIYSLGALLYELLTGETVFDADELRAAGYDEMRRIISEEDPSKPSTRLTTVSSPGKQTHPEITPGSLRGDLDWVVMKALEKDRRRRYETANALALEVKRHLADEPVSAGPPTAAYRMQKFLRRNRVTASFAAVLLASLIGGLALAATGFLRAKEESARAQEESERAREAESIATATSAFLIEDLLAQAGPDATPDRDLKLRVAVDRAAEKVGERFHDQPLVEAEVRMTIARVYVQVDEEEKARNHAERAAEIWARELGEEHPKTLRAKALYAGIGARDEGDIALLNSVIESQGRLLGHFHTDTLETIHRLGSKYVALGVEFPSRFGKLISAEWFKRQGEGSALEAFNVEGDAKRWTLALHLMRYAQWSGGSSDYLLAHLRVIINLYENELGILHPDTIMARLTLGRALMRRPDRESDQAAADLFRELVPKLKRMFGDLHPTTLESRRLLAEVLGVHLTKPAESLAIERELFELTKAEKGPSDPETVLQLGRLIAAESRAHSHDSLLSGAGGMAILDEFGPMVSKAKASLFALGHTDRSRGVMRSTLQLGEVILDQLMPVGAQCGRDVSALRQIGLDCYRWVISKEEIRRSLDRRILWHAHANLGEFYHRQAERGIEFVWSMDKAESHLLKALELIDDGLPDEIQIREQVFESLSGIYGISGRRGKLTVALESALESSLGRNWRAHRMFLRRISNLGNFTEATQAWMAGSIVDPDPDHGLRRRSALCALLAGEQARYEEICADLLDRYVNEKNVEVTVAGTAAVALLAPGNEARLSTAIDWLDKVEMAKLAKEKPQDFILPSALLAAYRSGDEEGTRELLRHRKSGTRYLHKEPLFLAISALMNHRSGDQPAALRSLDRASRLLDSVFLRDKKNSYRWEFYNGPASLLILEARREIEGANAVTGVPNRWLWDAHEAKVSMPETVETVITRGAEWKFLHPAGGIDPANHDPDFHETFFLPGYKDSEWERGKEGDDPHAPTAGFGYGDRLAVEWQTPAEGHRKTAYLRHHFSTAKPYDRLWLRMHCDDGAIVYLDGVEVGRLAVSKLDPEAYDLMVGPLFDVPEKYEDHWRPMLLKGGLAPGEHFLAISVHNSTAESDDLRVGNVTLFGRTTGTERIESP